MVLRAEGYQIPFSSVPPPWSFLRESSFSAQEACDAKVERFLQKSAIGSRSGGPIPRLLFHNQKIIGGNAIHSKFAGFKFIYSPPPAF